MTKIVVRVLILGLLVVIEAQAQTLFRIGSGGVGGTYFPIAELIAAQIRRVCGCVVEDSCGESGVLAVAQLSNGSVANVRDLGNRRLEAGLVQADVAYMAYRGEGAFVRDGSHDSLRAVANLYPEAVHLVVSAGIAVESVVDLAGRSVSLDEPGSGSLLGARLVLEAYGVQIEDLQAIYVKPTLAAKAMRENRLDAFFVTAGYPVAAVTELASTHGIRLISLKGSKAEALRENQPFFSTTQIPIGTYPGVDAATTLAVGAQLLVDAQLDDDLVYCVTRTIWQDQTQWTLREGHPRGRQIKRESALSGIVVPLHPGAERYYREVGLLVERPTGS